VSYNIYFSDAAAAAAAAAAHYATFPIMRAGTLNQSGFVSKTNVVVIAASTVLPSPIVTTMSPLSSTPPTAIADVSLLWEAPSSSEGHPHAAAVSGHPMLKMCRLHVLLHTRFECIWRCCLVL
jgi:hypothetical protein